MKPSLDPDAWIPARAPQWNEEISTWLSANIKGSWYLPIDNNGPDVTVYFTLHSDAMLFQLVWS